jgi:hypothetical protein
LPLPCRTGDDDDDDDDDDDAFLFPAPLLDVLLPLLWDETREDDCEADCISSECDKDWAAELFADLDDEDNPADDDADDALPLDEEDDEEDDDGLRGGRRKYLRCAVDATPLSSSPPLTPPSLRHQCTPR